MNASQPRPGASDLMSFVQKLCRNLARSAPVNSNCVQFERSNRAAPETAAVYSALGLPEWSLIGGSSLKSFRGCDHLGAASFGAASFGAASFGDGQDADIVNAQLTGCPFQADKHNRFARPHGN